MAKHIDSITGSGIATADASTFTLAARTGMLLFTSHSKRAAISAAIEDVTKSPFSHVGLVYQEQVTGKHLLLESVFPGGARMGSFDYYVSSYDGDLVLCDVSGLENVFRNLQQALCLMLTELDEPYDVEDEAKFLLHKFMPFVHPELGDVEHQCFCSAYMARGLAAAGYTIQPSASGMDVSPEELWLHSFIVPVVALVKGVGNKGGAQ